MGYQKNEGRMGFLPVKLDFRLDEYWWSNGQDSGKS